MAPVSNSPEQAKSWVYARNDYRFDAFTLRCRFFFASPAPLSVCSIRLCPRTLRCYPVCYRSTSMPPANPNNPRRTGGLRFMKRAPSLLRVNNNTSYSYPVALDTSTSVTGYEYAWVFAVESHQAGTTKTAKACERPSTNKAGVTAPRNGT